jgi:AMP deaminase
VDKKKIFFFFQVPRIYPLWKNAGFIEDFGEMMKNVFEPMFDVTMDPENDPAMAELMEYLVGKPTLVWKTKMCFFMTKG